MADSLKIRGGVPHYASPQFDQRGIARPAGLGPDIGAFESDDVTPNLCNGDGGDQLGCTDCPCSNNELPGTIGGCLNSFSTLAKLAVSWDASVTLSPGLDFDLRFALTGAPRTSFCRLFLGSGIAPANPANPCLGANSEIRSLSFDGLRCAITGIVCHGGCSAGNAGEIGKSVAPWGGEGAPASDWRRRRAPAQGRLATSKSWFVTFTTCPA